MATKSFYENLVIETEEQGQAVLKAFEDAENRIEKRTKPTSDELIAEGERWVREGGLDELILKISRQQI